MFPVDNNFVLLNWYCTIDVYQWRGMHVFWYGKEWQSISALLLSYCSVILPTHHIFDNGVCFHENMRKKGRSSRRRKAREETGGKRKICCSLSIFVFQIHSGRFDPWPPSWLWFLTCKAHWEVCPPASWKNQWLLMIARMPTPNAQQWCGC